MTKRMLIDATHPEETRVVVLDGSRVEEFDVETSTKKQDKGNIYLAKIVRVEPSLQAAFVEYGGNRHGFLAFNEIHPDYYQISDDDRALLIAEQEELARAESDEDDDENGGGDNDLSPDSPADPQDDGASGRAIALDQGLEASVTEDLSGGEESSVENGSDGENGSSVENGSNGENGNGQRDSRRGSSRFRRVGRSASAPKPRVPSRSYKIQDVIKRRQIVLVQVVKEERGNKGAALTTYLSLAGRYCVFVPNTTRGGGVSRKITNVVDRKRLKSIMAELTGPKGSAIILRTAGSERSKGEIKRDHDYLLRTWETVRTAALQAQAPCLIHEEGSLIKRAIRDIYSRDIDDVLVEGVDGYRAAKDFMRMLMPSHARRVQQYRDEQMPLFHRFQVESQMDAMLQPIAQLKSGGYLVINQTEALVAIDVNSGRSTRERNIDDTAFKTNLEAADEIARQLRLRDLAGLVVIDFIDMDDPKANAAVERRLKDALKSDRARIQVGHISSFGLLEMSRQRMRPSLMETSFHVCAHCRGTGMVRSVESTALSILRLIEEDGIRRKYGEISVTLPTDVALYILNRKRDMLAAIEQKYDLRVFLEGDNSLIIPDHRIDRVKIEVDRPVETIAVSATALAVSPVAVAPLLLPAPVASVSEGEGAEPLQETQKPDGADDSEGSTNGRKRRRRRRRRRGDGPETTETLSLEASDLDGEDEEDGENESDPVTPPSDGGETPVALPDEPTLNEPSLVAFAPPEDGDTSGEGVTLTLVGPDDEGTNGSVSEPDGAPEPDPEPEPVFLPPEETSPPKPARSGWWSR